MLIKQVMDAAKDSEEYKCGLELLTYFANKASDLSKEIFEASFNRLVQSGA